MISQYANSPKFLSLVNGLKSQFDNATLISDWYRIVYNIKTATGFGLDIWGLILNRGRDFTYIDPDTSAATYIYLKGAQTIDGTPFTAAQIEDTYRTILLLKAMGNITNASIRSLNDMLQFYFQDRGRMYVYEYNTMEIRYVFEFYCNKLEKSIFKSDVMPKPTGVGTSFEYIPKQSYFGFFVSGVAQADQPYTGFVSTFYR